MSALRGVGTALAARLARLGVRRVADLLFVLPLRYEDRTRVSAVGSLSPGVRAAVEGEVQLTEIAYRGRRQLLCRISDGSGMLTLRFFHFSASQQQGLARAASARCAAAHSGSRWCTRNTAASQAKPCRSMTRSRRSIR